MLYKAIPNIEQLEKWVELGVPFEYNDFMSPLMLDNKAEVKKRIKLYNSLKRDRSFDTLHGPFYDITVHSIDPKMRKISDIRIRQACDIAGVLNVSGVVLHTNLIANFYNKQYRDNWIGTNEQYFHNLLKQYKKLNIYMENMFDEEPDCLCALAERINNERFKICLDIGHCNISKTDVNVWVDRCGRYIGQYHINDNDGITDSHLAIGAGNMAWKRVLPILNADIPALIEVNEYDAFIKSRDYILINN